MVFVVAAMALAACSAARRYEVLSFFFDGVPDPSAPAPTQHTAEPVVRQRTVRPEAAPAVVLHQHVPYAQRQCDSCHLSGGDQGKARGAFSINSMSALKMPVEKLCASCHEPKPLAHQHAPALLGDCVRCHDPHASRYDHLVKKARTAELCAVCHTPDTMPTGAAHAGSGDRDCASCHDPHGSDTRHLLRSGIDPQLPAAATAPTAPQGPPAATNGGS